MNKSTVKMKVTALLEGTPERLRNIELLKYELQHTAKVTPDEMIGALAFAHPQYGAVGHVQGGVSNKTMNIALHYEEKTEEANAELTWELTQRLHPLEVEEKRLEKYISLLNTTLRDIIRLFYVEQKSWKEVGKTLNIPIRTAQRQLKTAIDELCTA